MKPYQRKLLFELLELTYSSKGYRTARSIINLESILGDYEARHSMSSEGGNGQWVRSQREVLVCPFWRSSIKRFTLGIQIWWSPYWFDS